MGDERKMTKHDAMVFFNRAWEFLAGLPTDHELDMQQWAEMESVDLDEAMRYVSGAVEKGYCAGGHADCTKTNVLRIYRPGEPLRLDRDHINGMAELLTIDLGYKEDR